MKPMPKLGDAFLRHWQKFKLSMSTIAHWERW